MARHLARPKLAHVPRAPLALGAALGAAHGKTGETTPRSGRRLGPRGAQGTGYQRLPPGFRGQWWQTSGPPPRPELGSAWEPDPSDNGAALASFLRRITPRVHNGAVARRPPSSASAACGARGLDTYACRVRWVRSVMRVRVSRRPREPSARGQHAACPSPAPRGAPAAITDERSRALLDGQRRFRRDEFPRHASVTRAPAAFLGQVSVECAGMAVETKLGIIDCPGLDQARLPGGCRA